MTSTRAGAHADSGHRLGVSAPQQEGPADLRLVPPALAAWAAAAFAVTAPADWAAAGATACVAAALCVVLGGAVVRRASLRRGVRTTSVAASALLCAAAAAFSGTLHAADLQRGPLPGLARDHAYVTADVTLTGDPRLTRPRVHGAQRAPRAVVLKADAERVTAPDGSVTESRTPVLVIVQPPASSSPSGAGGRGVDVRAVPGASGHPGPVPRRDGSGSSPAAQEGDPAPAGRNDAPSPALTGPGGGRADPGPPGTPEQAREASPRARWLALLPSTRLRVRAKAATPLSGGGGEPVAVVLRVAESERSAPHVIEGPSAVQRVAGGLRSGLREATDELTSDARALLPGLVIGDTSRMPPDLEESFHATDLVHLTAVSGANFSILLALLIGPPHLAIRAERRGLAPLFGASLRTTALLGGLLTLAFVVVCRPEPSVLRAAACGLVALLAIATGRRRSLLPALSAAVLLLVLYDPWLACSYGFLFSVLATGALLTIAPRWSVALQRRRVPPRLAEVLAAAAAAQAVCAPVAAMLAARVSLVAVPCNLLAELAVAPATVLGFAALALAPVALPLAKSLAWLGGWPAEWIAAVARTGAALPGAELDWPGGWVGGLLLAAVTTVVVLAAPRLLRHPWLSGACVLVLLLAIARPAPLPRLITGWPPPGWRFAVCDVGQGDALVLAAGEGTAVVVDAGPDPRLADRCLRALAVTRIPLVVLTHFHADHVAGLPGVLRGRAVGAIETTTLGEPVDQARFVRRVAAEARVPMVPTASGERRLGPLRWRVLWPPAGPSAHHAGSAGAPAPPSSAFPVPPLHGPNDASVTLLVRTAGLTLLLLGDLEPPAQQGLLTAEPDLPPVDVLKVAHHGSAYQDPQLLRRVRPRLAVISAGRDNPYGHPSPRTVTALRQHGATVLSTDTVGAIAVTGGPSSGLAAAVRGGRGGAAGTDSGPRPSVPVRCRRGAPGLVRRQLGRLRRRCFGASTVLRVPGGRWTKDRWHARFFCAIKGAWIPHRPTRTSRGSARRAPPGPMVRRCVSCNCTTCVPSRSRTSPSTSVRRSSLRRPRSSTRSCEPVAEVSATS
ncbi:ComEC/Rec2 family competence protein [Streptomyces sp. NPDC048639]|uniref:ComEC/Rec2 family competence protein n=1 Tax=Streptomyces sp. NPDC048639 TaxID=3365581 RepID=UPI0037124451